MKILNLYACLGGNRYKWGDEHEITAVELDRELAEMYQDRFPNDTVVCADAHQYLLDHYKEFDFIWSSPPCPTHSRARYWNSSNYDTTTKAIFPSIKGQYVVENVIPYYTPLIEAKKRGRHLYWTNFLLPNDLGDRRFAISQTKNELKELCKFHDYDFTQYKGTQSKVKIGRNLVDYEAGKTILDTAMGIVRSKNVKQTEMF